VFAHILKDQITDFSHELAQERAVAHQQLFEIGKTLSAGGLLGLFEPDLPELDGMPGSSHQEGVNIPDTSQRLSASE